MSENLSKTPYNYYGKKINIRLLAPSKNEVKIEWIGEYATYSVFISLLDGEVVASKKVEAITLKCGKMGNYLIFGGLKANEEYVICVTSEGGATDKRRFRTGDYASAIINYLHPEDDSFSYSGQYLCSPSIIKTDSGRLLASMDVYMYKGAQNLSFIFCSDDDGVTWHYLTDLFPCFWGKLFSFKGAIYILAQTTEYGDLFVSKASDDGAVWSAPVILMNGDSLIGPHSAPMPFTEWHGRVYKAIEYGSWNSGKHDMGFISFDTRGDVMDKENWVVSGFLQYDESWKGAPLGAGYKRASPGGGIEGNVVIAPDGTLKSATRMDISNATPGYGKMLFLRIDDYRSLPVFDRIVDCDVGANSKFYLIRDKSGKYIAIGNEQNGKHRGRTVLSMAVSSDLINWKTVKRIWDYGECDESKVGLQYPDWIFDGNDILLLTRTALNGANSFHNSNCITFFRLKNYEEYLK